METLETISSIWILVVLTVIVINIALIVAVFNISKRQTSQDKGQDIIIKLLKENNKSSKMLTKELEIANRNIYKLCELISGQEQEYYDEEYYEDEDL